MAAAPASAQRRRAGTRSAPAPRLVLGGNVRWDRIGRTALLLVLILVALLYIGPAKSWYATWQDSTTRHAELHRLEAENKRLKARKAALQDPRTLEHEARKLGMVRPGERTYLLDNLPE